MSTRTAVNSDQIVINAVDFDRLTHLLSSSARPPVDLPLRRELERGTVVPPTEVPGEVVTVHSRVRVSDTKLDEPEEYTLVYPDEADILQGRISVLAPIGAALLGARLGQVVKYVAPAGVRRLKVEKILYQPEAAGDYHL
jgi:regulator of nucleoside diphosphate kinase